jgi:thymidine phosphorylase
VQNLAARPIGHATMLLGAGRARMDCPVDHAVGAILHKKVGDRVTAGEPLATLLVNDESHLAEAQALVREAYLIGEQSVTVPPLFLERISASPA